MELKLTKEEVEKVIKAHALVLLPGISPAATVTLGERFGEWAIEIVEPEEVES